MMDVLLTILVAMGLSLLGRETWGWLPRLSRGVIWLHTMPLSKARRDIRREEWCAELAGEYEDRRLAGLFWALNLSRISALERVATSLPPALRWQRVGTDSKPVRAVSDWIEALKMGQDDPGVWKELRRLKREFREPDVLLGPDALGLPAFISRSALTEGRVVIELVEEVEHKTTRGKLRFLGPVIRWGSSALPRRQRDL